MLSLDIFPWEGGEILNKGKYKVYKTPISFQRIKDYESEDTRFTRVKIFLMHTGQNHKGSYFSKDVIEQAIPTLANTPILGFIEKNSLDEDDFSDHRYQIEKTDGGYKYVYKGSAYGLIPETNNAQFEMRTADDGIEREYLTAEGLIWSNKFPKAQSILDNSIEKDQSMELYEQYDGEIDENGIYHFKEFKFYGGCILGLGHQPGMEGSTIELMEYTNRNITDDINNKLEEFKQLFARKGGLCMDKKLKLLKEFSVTKEELVEKGVDFEAIDLDELKTKLEEFKGSEEEITEDSTVEEGAEKTEGEDFSTEEASANEDEADDSTKEDEKPEGDFKEDAESNDSKAEGDEISSEDDKTLENFKLEYKLSHDDVRAKLYEAIEVGDNAYAWIMEVYDDSVVYELETYTENGYERKYFKQSYAKMDTDEVVMGEAIQIYLKFLTEAELEILNKEKEELYELRNFKTDLDKKKRAKQEESLFNKYSMLKGLDEFEDLKQKASDFEDIEDLESKIALVYVRNNESLNFTKTDKDDDSNEIEFDDSEEKVDIRYGGLLEKYAK